MRLFNQLLCLFAAAICVAAEPPTDDQVRKAILFYEQSRKGINKPEPLVAEALKDIDINGLTVRQFEMFGLMKDTAPDDLIARFRDRLGQLGKSPDEEGAVALALRAGTFETVNEQATEEERTASINARIDAIIDAVNHPAFGLGITSGRASGVYWYSYFYSENPRLLESGIVRKMASLVTEEWPRKQIDSLLAFAEGYARPESGLTKEESDRLRATTTNVAQKVIQAPETEEDTRKGLLEALDSINSAWNRAELINRPAPRIRFIWSSHKNEPPASFKDFAGKVVLVDFWATWCGPCIASFPHLRELRERYKDSRVAILSITSLQGWMLRPWEAPENRRTGKLSREEELGLMDEWVRKMDMTWTVAVSEESAFNPDFGVRGIPSVAIIDSKGMVRHAGLSAFDDTIEAKIDALLVEAGQAVPPARTPAPTPSDGP